jgi:hypothetical protein
MDDEDQKKLPPLGKTLVRLHTPDGKVADSKPSDGGVIGSLGMIEYSFHYTFAWRRNLLEEAWIEVCLPNQTYWVEVPYGFTRDPAALLNPVEARRGPPKYPPTVKPGKTDWLVPWLEVSYDLGKIQNGWSANLNVANPFFPAFDVLLYREDFGNERNGHLWNLESPRTEMKINFSKDDVLESKRMGIRLHDDGIRRTDSFKLDKSYTGTERRWGTAVVKVDGKGYECVVPSSLFWEQHGATAERDHYKAFVPRLRERQ